MSNDINLNSIQFTAASKHQLVIGKFPGVEYNCTQVSLPGLSLGNVEQPNYFSSQLYWPGEKVVFDPLPIKFLIDEELDNYFEIAQWMIDVGTPVEDKSLVNRMNDPLVAGEGVFTDVSIISLSNARNAINVIKLINAFPVLLEPIDYDTGSMSEDALAATVTFLYERYTRERLPMHPETR